MPGPDTNLTLASSVRDGVAEMPANVAMGYLADALKKCIEDPGLSWAAAVAAVTTTVANPLAVAGILALGVAMKLKKLSQDKQQAQQVEAQLRAQAHQQSTMQDILLGIEDRSITVGLDELALADIKTIVNEVLQNKSDQLSAELEGAFNEELDELPPGPLKDDIQTLRIFAQDTNATVHNNAETLAELLEHARREKLSEEELRKQIRAEIEAEYAEKLANDADPTESADRAAQAVVDVSDTPGIENNLRENGGQAIIDALLNKQESAAAISIETHRQIAEWAYLIGNIDQAYSSVQIVLAHEPTDLDAVNRLGHIYKLRGNLVKAKHLYEKLLQLSDDDLVHAVAYGNLGLIYHKKGDFDQSERMYCKSLKISERLDRQEGMANQYGNLGLLYRIRGDIDQAEQMNLKAMEIDERLGRLDGMASNYGNLGLIYQARGDLDRAEEMHRKSLEIDKNLGRQEGVAAEYGNLGLICLARGDLDQAELMFSKSKDINESLGGKEGLAKDYGNIGLVYINRGDFVIAKESWTNAKNLFSQIGMPHMVKKTQYLIDALPSG